MKQLASVRTNLSFSVENGTTDLVPTVELVLLTYKPEYLFNSKREVQQKKSLEETRLILQVEGLNQLIANLQLAATELNQYEQMGIALNTVIKQIKTK
jgi:hypothetical protein